MLLKLPRSLLFCIVALCFCQTCTCFANIRHTTISPGTEKKVFFISQMLVRHPHLAEQIWNIGFTAMLNGFGRGSNGSIDPATKKMLFNYVLDNIPNLLKNKNFQNMVHDISKEVGMAYNRSAMSKNSSGVQTENKPITYEAAIEVLKHLDIAKVLKDSIRNGKPVIDAIRGNDSAVAIATMNYLIDIAPLVWKNPSFQSIKDIAIEELQLGYDVYIKDPKVNIKDDINNTTILIRNVLKHTNINRLLSKSLLAGKPIIDELRGKDSTSLLLGIGLLAKMYPKLMADKRFQYVKDVATRHFGQIFQELNYTKSDLQIDPSHVVKDVIANTNKFKLLQDILKGGSAMNVLPISNNVTISDMCYSDTVDFLDSVVNMAPWSLKMLDSYGKPGEGVLYGHLNMVGSYDECLDVRADIPAGTILGNRTKEKSRSFKTRYCRVSGKIPKHLVKIDTKGLSVSLTWGVCVPDSCHSADVKGVLQLKSFTKFAPFIETASVYCFEEEHITEDPSALTAIVILSIFGALVVFGTMVELILSQRTKYYKSWYLKKTPKLETGSNDSETKNEYIRPKFTKRQKDEHATERFTDCQKDEHTTQKFTDCPKNEHVTQKFTDCQKTEHVTQKFTDCQKNEHVTQKFTDCQKNEHVTQKFTDCQKNELVTQKFTESESNLECYDKNEFISNKDECRLPVGYMPHAEGRVHIVSSTNDATHVQRNEMYHQTALTPQNDVSDSYNRKDGTLTRLITSFAVQINTKKILTGKTGDNSINCIHGIRFLSLTWILLGHTYNYGFVSVTNLWTTDNLFTAAHWIERFSFQVALSAPLAVDSFYMISGMLVIYLQVKHVKKLRKDTNCGVNMLAYICKCIFHRVWRLTPLYMIVLMVFACLMKYFGDGPFWPAEIPSVDPCKTNWWTNLLYISNLLPHDDQCMSWSWFLSNDMQFYIVSIFFLIFLAISIPAGIVSILILMAVGISSAAYSEHKYGGDLLHVKADKNAYWDHVYIPPWCRVSAYCVGMMLGIILLKRPKQKLHWIAATVGWTVAIILGLVLVYIPYTEHSVGGTEWSLGVRTAYESLGRPVWASCVAWVIFACYNGNGGVVNTLLSWRGMVPFSRMSYAAYLVHPIVMMTYVYSRRSLFYLNDYNMIYLFLGHFVITFMASFVMSVLFEAPFMAMEKVIRRQ